MARRPTQSERRPANLSPQQMEAALPRIERRLADLKGFDIQSITDRSDPRISTLSNKLDDLLVSIFGVDTVEYNRYRSITFLDTASANMMYETPIHEVLTGLESGIDGAKIELQSIKEGFLESMEDAGLTVAGRALNAYDGLELHSAIERAAGKLYRGGHYANAIEDSVKALNALVRLNSGIDDRDGTALMEYVFSPRDPILKFNDLADESDKNEQKGFMMMFSGAVAGLRNPRAHKLIKDDPGTALEFIAFVSLLANLADRASK